MSFGRLSRLGLVSLAVFAAAALGAGLARAVTTTYLPVLLHRIEDAPGLIGTVMLVNAVAGFAVPLVVGAWSDRLGRRRHGRRAPFILGGALLTAGGLLAVALGSGSSYLVLALAGGAAYVGMNAVTTAHRALVPESFTPEGRARATSAQELALLVGSMLGLVAGGVLIDLVAWAPFALAALAAPLLALATVTRVREPVVLDVAPPRARSPVSDLARAATRRGVRALLAAQALWVLGYAALPTFFIVYADEVLGLDPALASVWLAGFGLVTAATTVASGRVRDPERFAPLLALGVALMGIGLLGVGLASELLSVAGALLAAAAGFGLISTLGFAAYAAVFPAAEAGVYTALFFSVRAIAAAVALPLAGWTIAASGSYRSLFVLGGAATLAALVPLRVASGRSSRADEPARGVRMPAGQWWARWASSLALLYAVTLAVGVLVGTSRLLYVDEAVFRAVNSFGPAPALLWEALNPHMRNYVLLFAVAAAAALLTNPRRLNAVLTLVGLSGLLSWTLLEGIYAVYDRPRPEEVLAASDIVLNGHTWSWLESFPSGHLAVTSALVGAIALAFPRLRRPLWTYVALVGITRVLFGAHFPVDTLAGFALGYFSARATFALLSETRLLETPPRAESDSPALAPAGP